MKKQSGFTLIELMVVMAIIAILATAGLSAYTGYIKKARDTKRIADLAAINTMILADMAADGLPPANGGALNTVIFAQNNGKAIQDPSASKSACISTNGNNTNSCYYYYKVCDGGVGYALATRFESSSNTGLYTPDGAGTGAADGQFQPNTMYSIGSCVVSGSADFATF